MILADVDIDHIIKSGKAFLVNPYNEEMLQCCSIDLTLGEELKTINGKCIDLTQDSYKLKPNEFILGCTSETIHVPRDLMARVEGRSSIGRLGVMIHVTAGLIDPNFTGQITLEIYNASDKPFELIHGDSICQIVFETLSSPCMRPYGSAELGSKYQNSKGCVTSRYEPL
jgi:dCTP deaminase